MNIPLPVAASRLTVHYPRRSLSGQEAQCCEIVYWEEDGAWLGYLQEFPDYWTQGEPVDDLTEHLRDLYADLSGGHIPGARRVDDLIVTDVTAREDSLW